MNRTDLNESQKLYTGAKAGGSVVHTTNLFNEGIIGYSALALIVFSGLGWVRQTLSLSHLLTNMGKTAKMGVTG